MRMHSHCFASLYFVIRIATRSSEPKVRGYSHYFKWLCIKFRASRSCDACMAILAHTKK